MTFNPDIPYRKKSFHLPWLQTYIPAFLIIFKRTLDVAPINSAPLTNFCAERGLRWEFSLKARQLEKKIAAWASLIPSSSCVKGIIELAWVPGLLSE